MDTHDAMDADEIVNEVLDKHLNTELKWATSGKVELSNVQKEHPISQSGVHILTLCLIPVSSLLSLPTAQPITILQTLWPHA
jgi:hypothetical protein